MISELKYRLRALLRLGQMDREFTDELAFHVERETEKGIARGLTPVDARRRALVALGGLESAKEAHRDGRGSRWIADGVSDIRLGLRGLRHNPALAGAAIFTIAIAIAANTAIFSAVNAVLLAPLPFADPTRLVLVGEDNPEFHWHLGDAAPANYLDWTARVHRFAKVMAYSDFGQPLTLISNGEPRLVNDQAVTGNFFDVLGVSPERGRFFRDDETWSTGAPAGVVISDRLWRQSLGADPAIVGKSISLSGRAHTVIGVARPGFVFPSSTIDIWLPFAWSPASRNATSFRRAHWLRVVARLSPGATPAGANAELRGVAAQLKREYPATNRVMDAELTPLHTFLVGDSRLPLLMLFAAVALLLMIACANVGNLLLVRAAAREREVALRLAIGASAGRLIRQALTDSVLLSLLGGTIGLALGAVLTRALAALAPSSMIPAQGISIDWHVALYVFAVTVVAGIAFGVAPAGWAARIDPAEPLRSSGRSGGHGIRVKRWGQRLVVAEVAIAMVMSMGAGLLVKSYALLGKVDPGFDPRNVMTATISLPGLRYDSLSRVDHFFESMEDRLRAVPGVTDAAAVSHLPLTQVGWSSDFSIEGPSAGHFSASLIHREIRGDYFRAMRVPLIRGRTIATDETGPPYSVVINEAFATQFFAGKDPIGQRITFDRDPDSASTWRTIVGVVGNEHQTSPSAAPQIEVFEPLSQELSREMTVIARTTSDPGPLAGAIRGIVRDLDPGLAITDISRMSDVSASAVARERFLMTLLSAFGVVGLLLAVIGVYGVIAQLVRARRREMGIRIALGAPLSEVRWLVVRYGIRLSLTGVAIGTIVSLLAAPKISALLFGVAPRDPMTMAAVAASLLAAAFVASLVPGLRAARVQPLDELRVE